MKTYFVNEAIDKALHDYINNSYRKESVIYNSFLVVVIRMLINIYGELDIISPYQTKNESTFTDNLRKYGATSEDIREFIRLVDGFYYIEKKNMSSMNKENNPYFIDVQKKLIDLFNLKRLNYGLSNSDRKEFFDLLYTPGTSNVLRLSYNFLNADDIYEIAEYFKTSMSKKKEIKPEKSKELLPFNVYKLFGLEVSDISQMDDEGIKEINKEIYSSFDIKENAMNKDYLLDAAIKKYHIQRNVVTTGNGYVDILLVMSIIVTMIMVGIIFGTIIF